MKRVLIITYYWPPVGGSGVQRWVKFAKYLPSEGWQPVIYTPENPDLSSIDESLLEDIPAEAEIIKAKFGAIPIFVVGDMNCEENTIPIQQFLQEGYVPCYKVATVYADNNNGHHVCSPGEGYSTISKRKGPDRETGAIDHCFILDQEGKTEIKVFDCIMEEYTVKLTDHYPLLIDVKL